LGAGLAAAPGRVSILVLALFLGLASGCGSTPESHFYTLAPMPAARRPAPLAGGPLALGLGPVSFPAFLDRPQIVYRDSDNRLSLDELNRWGGTLQDDFLRVWSENLSYLLGTSRIVVFPTEVRYPLDFRIAATVLAFEGTPDGEAVLKVRWSVLDPFLEKPVASHEGTYRQPLAPQAPRQGGGLGAAGGAVPDRSALIAALSAALGELSQDVARVIAALPKPTEPPKDAPLY
jgi:uncharacterized lipoprotein YmbA